jgi:hypothetical protein
MQSYNYRSVKAIAEYRYHQMNQNPSNRSHVAPSKIWRDDWYDSMPDRPSPARRKQRSNDRAPDSSRAA